MTERPGFAAIARRTHSGTANLVLPVAAALALLLVAVSLLPQEAAHSVSAGILGILAVAGACAILATAAGILQVAGSEAKAAVTRHICDESPDGLIVTAPDGRILYVNGAYRRMTGMHDSAQLRTVERLFHGAPDTSEAIYRLAKAAREGRCRAEELRLCPPLSGEGTVAWFRIKVRPLARIRRRCTTLWAIADVTRERDRQETAFQELQYAVEFLDNAPAGFLASDRDGDVSYMNATLAAWLDYDLADVGAGGSRIGDLVAEGDASRLASMTGRPGEVRTEQLDIDLKRRGGQILPVRLLHRVTFDSDGRPGTSRTLVLERTSGEGPAEDLRAAEVRFARVFNTTPVAIAMLDKDHRIARSNGAFVRLAPEALRAADASGSVEAAIIERDRPALATALAAAVEGKSDIPPVEVGLVGEGERSALLFVTASDDGEGVGATIYALDTTEQRALQRNLAQAAKMNAIGQLAGGVAHDFNNLLTVIIGHSDLLLANHRATDPSFHDIMQIKQNANRAAGLVRQLLAFSRRQTLRPQVLQLGDVLFDLQMLMRRLVGEKIDLDLRHGRDLWLVKADLNQFEQVMINLIVNARDAMPQGGKILVRTRNMPTAECNGLGEATLVAADYVAIEVEDFGHGMVPEVKEKIFEPFFTTKAVGEGTGLGLATVYGIVKQTGGYVFCASTLGKGTTFTILLPRLSAEEAAVIAQREAVKVQPTDLTGHGTILLVEDEEGLRALGARELTSRGYTVLQAGSGQEALEIAEQRNGAIDLVVSDVVMPEMDGPTMFGELRKRGVKAKVIFVSGYAEDAFDKNLPRGEEFAFLAKPFSLKQLVEAVKGQAAA
jgi:two-component system cell cycle sensor histidine kinase/response regulator CckA